MMIIMIIEMKAQLVYKNKVKKTMEQEQNERMDKGVQIYLNKQVIHVDGLEDVYIVKSCIDKNKLYTVENDECDCMDFQRRRAMCKHIWSTIYYTRLGMNNND